MLIAKAIGYCIVAAACHISRLAFQLILKVAKHNYMYTEVSNYGQRLANG